MVLLKCSRILDPQNMLKNCKYYWESMFLPLGDHVVKEESIPTFFSEEEWLVKCVFVWERVKIVVFLSSFILWLCHYTQLTNTMIKMSRTSRLSRAINYKIGHKVTRALCVRVFSVASIAIANSRLSLHLYSSLWSASCITPLLQTKYNPFAKVSIDSLPPRVSHFTGCFF